MTPLAWPQRRTQLPSTFAIAVVKSAVRRLKSRATRAIYQALIGGSGLRRSERYGNVLVTHAPISVPLDQAEGGSYRIVKGSPVRQRPTALQHTVSEANVHTGGDLQILKCELCSAKNIWLPLAPTRPIRCGGCVLQGGKYVKNAYG